MRSRILKYAERSSIMNISITLGKKQFTFNLNEELKINVENIEHELKSQPSYYGYLGMLKNKLQSKVSDGQLELTKKQASLYLKYKNDSNETNKAEASRSAKYQVDNNPLYIGMCRKQNKLKEDFNTIQVCLDSFDQRSRMVQSINTNRRQEGNL